ncbi:MAG: AI-2E family transporter, partial [Chloroflexota bacterium]|nr:AI-2E family transporter [Chloroflexota bacterium]
MTTTPERDTTTNRTPGAGDERDSEAGAQAGAAAGAVAGAEAGAEAGADAGAEAGAEAGAAVIRTHGPVPGVTLVSATATATPPEPEDDSRRTVVVSRVEIPVRTIVRVVVAIGVILLLIQLWTTILLIFIAFLLAIALNPLVIRLTARGLPRVGAVALIVLSLVGLFALVLTLLIPPLVDQGRLFAADFDGYIEDLRSIADDNEVIDDQIESATDGGGGTPNPSAVFSRFLSVGSSLVSGLANLVILIVLAVYILVDGERIYDWIARYLPASQKAKVRRALPEIGRVISGYVTGQAINSTLFGVFAFIVLSILGVPQPLFLALLAAFADAIPIAGVLIATVPAVLLALTGPSGSITTAAIVLALYVAYQQIENYVIVPRVFGNTLQISSFAILVAVLVGGQLLGIIGVILALPLAAAIPVIEKIWRADLVPGGALATGAPDAPAPG